MALPTDITDKLYQSMTAQYLTTPTTSIFYNSSSPSSSHWPVYNSSGGTTTTSTAYTITNHYITDVTLNSILDTSLLGDISIEDGREVTINLPNGAKLRVEADGSYEIEDEGKIRYKGCKIREFNRFVNASDLVEEFIRFMGQKFNVKQSEILDIPIELFITWLILKACQEDGDEVPLDVPKIEDHSFVSKKTTIVIPRCRWCGRFISKVRSANKIMFCNPYCMDKMVAKLGVV